jgi:hypothetical protein
MIKKIKGIHMKTLTSIVLFGLLTQTLSAETYPNLDTLDKKSEALITLDRLGKEAQGDSTKGLEAPKEAVKIATKYLCGRPFTQLKEDHPKKNYPELTVLGAMKKWRKKNRDLAFNPFDKENIENEYKVKWEFKETHKKWVKKTTGIYYYTKARQFPINVNFDQITWSKDKYGVCKE